MKKLLFSNINRLKISAANQGKKEDLEEKGKRRRKPRGYLYSRLVRRRRGGGGGGVVAKGRDEMQVTQTRSGRERREGIAHG